MGPIISAILGIIPGITTSITEYVQHRMKLTELTRQAEIEAAKVEVQVAGTADAAQVEDNKKSWKDEYVILLVTLPIVGCFIPRIAVYVEQGFKLLSTVVPDWYTGLYCIVVLSVIGARTYFKYFKLPGKK